MGNEQLVTGNCLCGDVRYEIEGGVSAIWFCHCSKCRKASGSAFMPGTNCRARRFRWVSGEDLVTEYCSASGYRKRFCQNCGSPVPVVGDSYVYIPAGTLNEDANIRLAHHIHVDSKAVWYEIWDGRPEFSEGPDGSSHPRPPR